ARGLRARGPRRRGHRLQRPQPADERREPRRPVPSGGGRHRARGHEEARLRAGVPDQLPIGGRAGAVARPLDRERDKGAGREEAPQRADRAGRVHLRPHRDAARARHRVRAPREGGRHRELPPGPRAERRASVPRRAGRDRRRAPGLGRGLLAPVRPPVPGLHEPAVPRHPQAGRAVPPDRARRVTSRPLGEVKVDVLVVGGGLTGLTTAFWLSRLDPAARVVVLEASPRAGGKASTVDVRGFAVDTGPGERVLEPDGTAPRLGTLGVTGEVAPPATEVRRRYLVGRGRLVPVPSGPLGFLASPLLPPLAKARALLEPTVAPLA